MDSYGEVRRVRERMSASADHDIRKLIATINERRKDASLRIIDPGTRAEQCDEHEAADHVDSRGESSPAAT